MIATNVRTLGAIVRQKRKALDWSQDRLATAAGVSRPWLSAFEAGKVSVEIGLVFAVLDALGMNVNVTSSSASRAEAAPRVGTSPAPDRAAKSARASVSKAKAPRARTSGAKAVRASAARAMTPRDGPSTTRADAVAKTSRSERPPLTIGGKSISSARARGSSPIKVARPASSRGQKQ